MESSIAAVASATYDAFASSVNHTSGADAFRTSASDAFDRAHRTKAESASGLDAHHSSMSPRRTCKAANFEDVRFTSPEIAETFDNSSFFESSSPRLGANDSDVATSASLRTTRPVVTSARPQSQSFTERWSRLSTMSARSSVVSSTAYIGFVGASASASSSSFVSLKKAAFLSRTSRSQNA